MICFVPYPSLLTWWVVIAHAQLLMQQTILPPFYQKSKQLALAMCLKESGQRNLVCFPAFLMLNLVQWRILPCAQLNTLPRLLCYCRCHIYICLFNFTLCNSKSNKFHFHTWYLVQDLSSRFPNFHTSLMGLRDVIRGCSGGHYHKLTSEDKSPRPGIRWLRNVNGKVFGLRLSSSKRLKWKQFSVIMLPRRIFELYEEISSAMKPDGVVYPTINFSSHWGLPVISHPSIVCRKKLVHLNRKFCRWTCCLLFLDILLPINAIIILCNFIRIIYSKIHGVLSAFLFWCFSDFFYITLSAINHESFEFFLSFIN